MDKIQNTTSALGPTNQQDTYHIRQLPTYHDLHRNSRECAYSQTDAHITRLPQDKRAVRVYWQQTTTTLDTLLTLQTKQLAVAHTATYSFSPTQDRHYISQYIYSPTVRDIQHTIYKQRIILRSATTHELYFALFNLQHSCRTVIQKRNHTQHCKDDSWASNKSNPPHQPFTIFSHHFNQPD